MYPSSTLPITSAAGRLHDSAIAFFPRWWSQRTSCMSLMRLERLATGIARPSYCGDCRVIAGSSRLKPGQFIRSPPLVVGVSAMGGMRAPARRPLCYGFAHVVCDQGLVSASMTFVILLCSWPSTCFSSADSVGVERGDLLVSISAAIRSSRKLRIPRPGRSSRVAITGF